MNIHRLCALTSNIHNKDLGRLPRSCRKEST